MELFVVLLYAGLVNFASAGIDGEKWTYSGKCSLSLSLFSFLFFFYVTNVHTINLTSTDAHMKM